MRISSVAPEHREPILGILRRTGAFSPDEIEVAAELVDLSIGDQARGEPGKSGYTTWVAEEEGAVLGYVCYGPTPMTERTYDLYWIAVDPSRQTKGTGRALVAALEAELAGRGGGQIRIETSSKESYGGTQRFYERTGFLRAAVLADFYSPGDDLFIYYKKVG